MSAPGAPGSLDVTKRYACGSFPGAMAARPFLNDRASTHFRWLGYAVAGPASRTRSSTRPARSGAGCPARRPAPALRTTRIRPRTATAIRTRRRPRRRRPPPPPRRSRSRTRTRTRTRARSPRSRAPRTRTRTRRPTPHGLVAVKAPFLYTRLYSAATVYSIARHRRGKKELKKKNDTRNRMGLYRAIPHATIQATFTTTSNPRGVLHQPRLAALPMRLGNGFQDLGLERRQLRAELGHDLVLELLQLVGQGEVRRGALLG